MNRFRSLSSLAALSLLAAAAFGQDSPPQAQFGGSVEVRVVNVEVQVTDRDGVPVNGLEKGDFELLVDGKPVEITNFDRATRPVPPSAPEAAAPPAEAAAAGVAPPSVERPRLMVWIDDLHLLPNHRNRVLKELASLLQDQETLGVDVGIVRYDHRIEILRLPGERRRPISRVLDDLSRRQAAGIVTESARRFAFAEIEDRYSQDGCNNREFLVDEADRYAEPLKADVQVTFDALQDFVASMAGLHGRRAVLYVADSLPSEPGKEAYLFIEQLCPQVSVVRDNSNVATRLREVSAAANSAGVTFYTFSAGGLPVNTDIGRATVGLDTGLAFIARGNDQAGLTTLATDTGGRSLVNSNRIEPLIDQFAQDFATSYSLGFSPSGPPDGREHRIVVKVKRDGVRVRSRDSFFDRPNDERRSDRLVAALRFGGAGENPLAVQIEVAPTKPIDKELVELPIRLLIPAANLVFQPGDDAEARLEIGLAVSDDRGRTAPVVKRYVGVKRSQLTGELLTAIVRVPLDLKLRKGPTNLAILVRDSVGDNESLLSRSIDLR